MSGVKLGRLVLDDMGIHKSKWLGVFGEAFSLPWSSIVAWGTSADILRTHEHPQGYPASCILELDHAGGTHVVRWGRGEEDFVAFVTELARRIPDRRRAGTVGHAYDARIPERLAKLGGIHRE